MQYKSALNLSFIPVEVHPSKFGKVPWTFQIVDVVFVSRAPHILSILSVDIWIDKVGIMNDSFMCVIYAVHLKIANLRRYSIVSP